MPLANQRALLTTALIAVATCPDPAQAAFVSELFQTGPAGQAIELSGIDPAQGATLAILNGSRFDAAGFGQVLELIHLPASMVSSPVVMITDLPWPDATVQATPLADVDNASGSTALTLGNTLFDRLLVVFDGATNIQLGDNPVSDAAAQSRYDANAVTDWLAIGPTGLANGYTGAGFDIAGIDQALGIDLLARTADRTQGEVIARTNLPGQPVAFDQTWVGDPDTNGIFEVGPGQQYRSTPGNANLPILSIVPEPGSAAAMLLGGVLIGARRRRPPRCS